MPGEIARSQGLVRSEQPVRLLQTHHIVTGKRQGHTARDFVSHSARSMIDCKSIGKI